MKSFTPLAGSLLVVLALGHAPVAQQPVVPPAVKAAAARITTEQLKSDLEHFASDALKGRNTPSPGFDAAAAYIENRLRRAGVKPLGDDGTYRQHYVMRETTLNPGETTVAIGQQLFKLGDGFSLRTFAGELTTGPVRAVYVGHGWTADGIDPYRGVDVKGKVVVVHAPSARPAGVEIRQLGRVTLGGTSPVVEAERRGALAVIYLASSDPQRGGGRSGSQAIVRRELEPGVPSAYAAPIITSIQLGAQATHALLHGTALDPALLDVQTTARKYPSSFDFPDLVSIRVPATSVPHRPFNVVGLIEGTDPALRHEYIVIESHLDGAVGTRTVEGDAIYNSADDNATGSAANLSIAEQMTAVRPRRSLIFLWDSGEEQGLWGTRRFVSRPPVPLSNIVAMINIDMIGANRAAGGPDAGDDRVTGPDEVFLIGPGVLSDAASSLIERVNGEYLRLSFNRKYDTPESEFFYPRTDAGPFLERNVLTIGFTTGLHNRYHLPSDEARFLDVAKMTAITRTVFAVAHALGETPERPRIEKPIPPAVQRVGGRGERPARTPGRPPLGMAGPWNSDILVFRAAAAGTVAKLATFERAGVSTVARMRDGRLIAAHQHFPADSDADFDKVAVRFSSDDGVSWTAPQVIRLTGLPEGMRFPFDPTLVPLPDGKLRLYFTSLRGRRFDEDLPAIYSAISSNGIDFVVEPGRRFGIDGRHVIDCAVVLHDGVFHLYAPDNGEQPRPGAGPPSAPDRSRDGIGYHATSRDGLTFTRADDVRIDGRRRWLGAAHSDGRMITFFGTGDPGDARGRGAPRGSVWMAQSRDGQSWQSVAAPAIPGADPGAVAARDGAWIFTVTGPPVRTSPSR